MFLIGLILDEETVEGFFFLRWKALIDPCTQDDCRKDNDEDRTFWGKATGKKAITKGEIL